MEETSQRHCANLTGPQTKGNHSDRWRARLTIELTAGDLSRFALRTFFIKRRGGESSRHSGPHCMHDIFSAPHIRFMRKEQKKFL